MFHEDALSRCAVEMSRNHDMVVASVQDQLGSSNFWKTPPEPENPLGKIRKKSHQIPKDPEIPGGISEKAKDQTKIVYLKAEDNTRHPRLKLKPILKRRHIIAGSTRIAFANGRESASEGPGASDGRQRWIIQSPSGASNNVVPTAAPPTTAAAAAAAGSALAAVPELHQRYLITGKDSIRSTRAGFHHLAIIFQSLEGRLKMCLKCCLLPIPMAVDGVLVAEIWTSKLDFRRFIWWISM